ncbi:SRPBCC family protein [Evansella tamaricis]|uniref:Coenzyme Q-binding protein COQ10 START domain-containing protein n=1 Tax=Evansella tamaricis TaxID=2069301 RepID=A0ABS6JFC9_9BACI|nr:hypothetical protein [Evansella tamaricis]MBU9712341.1 hypothetical protein [Evansella tamaricis]
MGNGTFEYISNFSKESTELHDLWRFFSSADNLAKITPFPKVIILSNPVTTIGNKIEMELNFYLFRLKWHSKIIDMKVESYFIDVGQKIPFPFRKWKHIHEFEVNEGVIQMRDIVEYEAYLPRQVISVLLWFMFSGRKKELMKVFNP